MLKGARADIIALLSNNGLKREINGLHARLEFKYDQAEKADDDHRDNREVTIQKIFHTFDEVSQNSCPR